MSSVDPKFLSQLRYRCIGPSRGGRVVAVAADPKKPAVFYHGAVAGGVWKSDDAGQYWENITDGFLTTGSIGALAVAPSDGNVIYAGTGEATIRIRCPLKAPAKVNSETRGCICSKMLSKPGLSLISSGREAGQAGISIEFSTICCSISRQHPSPDKQDKCVNEIIFCQPQQTE